MKKFILQFSILIIIFTASWYGLSRISWVSVFRVEEAASKLEKELGDFYIKSLSLYGSRVADTEIYEVLEEIKEKICSANDINPSKIKLHVVKTSDVNAFAAPDNNLIVFTGLIKYCNSYEEIAGVMAHEIAHLEKSM